MVGRTRERIQATARRMSVAAALVMLMSVSGIGIVPIAAQDVDCDDFDTQVEALAALEADPTLADSLDGDGDGMACESLPRCEGAGDEADKTAEAEPLAARLGGTRESFDQTYGEPNEDADIPRYGAEGYGSLLVVYDGDRAASVTMFADRPLDKPRTEPDEADWSVDKAHELARRFLPIDAEIDEDMAETAFGDVTAAGHSEALAESVSEDTYEELGVGGESGDFRYTLFLTEDGTVSSVNLGLGTIDRCESVAPAVVEAIATGILPETGATLRGAQAVRSKDFERVWFVAADLEGPGLDGTNQIGLWATNDIEQAGGGLILAVDGIATEFTDWGDGGSTDAELDPSDGGAEEAKQCVQRSLG